MNDNLRTLLWFAAERQQILIKRLRNEAAPWTTDVILQKNRFTNVHRVADRATQFLLKNVLQRGEQTGANAVFRALLFRSFARPTTWTALEQAGVTDIHSFDPILAIDALREASKHDNLYTGAYQNTGHMKYGETDRYANNIRLVEMLLHERVENIAATNTMKSVVQQLRVPGIGPFGALQIAIDISYIADIPFRDTYVVEGPGSRQGAKLCFPSTRTVPAIVHVYKHFDELCEEAGVIFETIAGTTLSPVDVEHLFCEAAKYLKIAAHTGRGYLPVKYRKFKPKPLELPLVFPPAKVISS